MAGAPDLVERIDRILPQTQCRQCGFEGCRPYAEAIASGEADIDRCPPGGDPGARALARLLGVPPKPFDRGLGLHKPPQAALVVEADCIGCTKCIRACPVDAIAGGSKLMHTVIERLCTGCELCVPACPVDCIVMIPMGPPLPWSRPGADPSTDGPDREHPACAQRTPAQAEQIRSTR